MLNIQTQEQIDKNIDDYCSTKICPYRWQGNQPGECVGIRCMKFSIELDKGELSVGYGDLMCEGIKITRMKVKV
jgi:hypothetical protein